MNLVKKESASPFEIDPNRWVKARLATWGAIIGGAVAAAVYARDVKSDLSQLKDTNAALARRMDSIEAKAQEEHDFRIRLSENMKYLVNDRRGPKPSDVMPSP